MVALLPGRLRAAGAEGSWTIGGLAKKLGAGENRQTIHHLMQGDDPTKCRSSRRQKLARVLQVPEKWLAGEHVEFPITGVVHLEISQQRSPRLALATARLMRRCVNAVQRDLTRYRAEPDKGDPWSATDEVQFFIGWAVGQLSTSQEWQHTLLRPRKAARSGKAEGVVPVPMGKPPTLETVRRISADDEAASLALVQAFDLMLAPWFTDVAGLRYDKLRGLLESVARGARSLPPSSDRPNTIYSEDGRRLSPSDPETPYALIRWPREKNRPERKR